MGNKTIAVTKPTLLLDKDKCLNNISRMAEKAKKAGVVFRPHFKTHQSAVIGEWFREAGMSKITVSSVKMAEYFAESGWNDITIAFPVNLLETDRINQLAGKITLNILLESAGVARILGNYLQNSVSVFIKIDTGYHRAGVWYENIDEIEEIVKTIDIIPNMKFAGFITHSGQNYNAKDEDEIIENHNFSLKVMNKLKAHFRKEYPEHIVSIGDTPGCSISDEFYGIDEIRPGNFVFYDLTQFILGSCNDTDIAVAMACPVVAKHAERKEIVIYGGGVHFSKEYLKIEGDGNLCGSIVMPEDRGWTPIVSGLYLASLSQEHGIVKCNEEMFKEFEVGDIMCIVPVHSCMTVNEMKRYYTLEGELIETMK